MGDERSVKCDGGWKMRDVGWEMGHGSWEKCDESMRGSEDSLHTDDNVMGAKRRQYGETTVKRLKGDGDGSF